MILDRRLLLLGCGFSVLCGIYFIFLQWPATSDTPYSVTAATDHLPHRGPFDEIPDDEIYPDLAPSSPTLKPSPTTPAPHTKSPSDQTTRVTPTNRPVGPASSPIPAPLPSPVPAPSPSPSPPPSPSLRLPYPGQQQPPILIPPAMTPDYIPMKPDVTLKRLLAVEELENKVNLLAFGQSVEGIPEDYIMNDDKILPVKPREWRVPETLFFLHVPKTAGFTFTSMMIRTMLTHAMRFEDLPKNESSLYCRQYCQCARAFSNFPPPPLLGTALTLFLL